MPWQRTDKETLFSELALHLAPAPIASACCRGRHIGQRSRRKEKKIFVCSSFRSFFLIYIRDEAMKCTKISTIRIFPAIWYAVMSVCILASCSLFVVLAILGEKPRCLCCAVISLDLVS